MKHCEISHFPECSFPLQEGFNTLATNLTFTDKSIKRIMLTSSYASEGKTLISMNLMRTLSGLGYNVVLVDADIRRSQIRSQYKLNFNAVKEKGLAHYLAGMCEISDILYETNIPQAYMVPIGREVKNSLQLLSSPRLDALLRNLAQRFDYVLVDAPPVGAIIDAAQIAKSCDGTLVVVQYNAVSRKSLKNVCLQMKKTGCPVLGIVLNSVDTKGIGSKYYYRHGYYYRYDQYYAADTPRHGKR